MINMQREAGNSCGKVCKFLPDCTLSYPQNSTVFTVRAV
jgi:hypothetical protein